MECLGAFKNRSRRREEADSCAKNKSASSPRRPRQLQGFLNSPRMENLQNRFHSGIQEIFMNATTTTNKR